MARPFRGRFRAIAEPLFGRPLKAEDGYSKAELDSVSARCGYRLPEALLDFYLVVGRFEQVIEAHNRFYAPDGLIRMDGRLVFCEENQAVVYWGYEEEDGGQTDPPVLQGVDDEPIEWHPEADCCSDFLAGMIYWQALFGGLPNFQTETMPLLVRAAARGAWPLVWEDEDTQVFSRGSVVFALTDADDQVDVQASALHETELDELLGVLRAAAKGA